MVELGFYSFQLIVFSSVVLQLQTMRKDTHIKQGGDTGPVDIRIKQASGDAFASHGERQIDRHGALAHSALGTADCDDFADIW